MAAATNKSRARCLLGLSTLFLALLLVLAGPAATVATRGRFALPGCGLRCGRRAGQRSLQAPRDHERFSLRQFQKESTPSCLAFLGICLVPGSTVLIEARYHVGLTGDQPVVWWRLDDFRPLTQQTAVWEAMLLLRCRLLRNVLATSGHPTTRSDSKFVLESC